MYISTKTLCHSAAIKENSELRSASRTSQSNKHARDAMCI